MKHITHCFHGHQAPGFVGPHPMEFWDSCRHHAPERTSCHAIPSLRCRALHRAWIRSLFFRAVGAGPRGLELEYLLSYTTWGIPTCYNISTNQLIPDAEPYQGLINHRIFGCPLSNNRGHPIVTTPHPKQRRRRDTSRCPSGTTA